MKYGILPKFVIGVLATAAIMGSFLVSYSTAPRAHAQFGGPVVVIGDLPSIQKQVVDAIAWTVAKTAVQSLTQSIVNWINSGFEGSPAFVTDLENNLGNLSDAVA